MGKQVRIYAAPEDLIDLEHALIAKTELVVLAYRSEIAGPTCVDFSLPNEQMGKTDLSVRLARPEDLQNLVFQHVPSRSYWTIDVLRSPVVEFSRCYFNGEILRQGRMFINTGYYCEDGEWRDKPDAFLKWADSIFANVKKLFKRDAAIDAYVGRHADTWRQQSGGKFVDK